MRWLIGIIIVTVPMFAFAAEDSDKPKEPAKKTLRLLAEKRPAAAETVDALVSKSWALRGLKNILGQGADEILTFKKSEKGELTVEQTIQKFRSVNQRAPAGAAPLAPYTETKTTWPAEVDRSTLQYGDRRQSYVLVPNERLILNAMVPLGEGRWHYASERQEMLFTFATDPVQQDHGEGTLQVRRGDAGKIATIKIKFDMASSGRGGRIIRVIADTEQKAVWAEIQFEPGGKYGLMLDHSVRQSQVLTPVKP